MNGHSACVAALWCALLGMGLLGCDLFSTRDAEPPNAGQGTWETPRVPADVMDNLEAAFFERDGVNYLRSFDPAQFSFEPDPATLSRDPALVPWAFEQESQHITRLFSEGTLPQDSLCYVVLSARDETDFGDSAEIRADYDLIAGVALAGVPGQMAGTAYFSLHVGSEGYWQIHRWRDTRTEDLSTWSDLKSLVR